MVGMHVERLYAERKNTSTETNSFDHCDVASLDSGILEMHAHL